jgi:aspartyl-tRNA(Asn)/glutamyl-tRNA(Gln) amidotransferase subunit C
MGLMWQAIKMDKKEMEITARLARLELSEEELTRLEEAVAQMLDYFTKMREVDVDHLAPTTQMVKDNRLREDEINKEDAADRILDNAPETEERFIVIPNVL